MSGYTEIGSSEAGHVEPQIPAARKYEIEYVNPLYSDEAVPTLSLNQEGYLSVTPDFIAISNAEGMVTFFMPADKVVKAVSTGVVETAVMPSGAVN